MNKQIYVLLDFQPGAVYKKDWPFINKERVIENSNEASVVIRKLEIDCDHLRSLPCDHIRTSTATTYSSKEARRSCSSKVFLISENTGSKSINHYDFCIE